MTAAATTGGGLVRRLTTRDAVAIGLGSMLGAGVFAVWAPAAAAAGWWLLLGLAVAAVAAWCNATSTAALAVALPVSGGAYAFGRDRLGAGWGFLAGWAFVVGKTASCAAMALTVGSYLWPEQARAVAVGAVLLVVAVDGAGITRTARATRVLLALTLTALTVVLGASLPAAGSPDGGTTAEAPAGVLTAAGLLFFAFAGYARIATLAEEVREPARTIPRAVTAALGSAVVVYTVVGVAVLAVLGPQRLAGSTAPLADAVRAGPVPGLAWVAAAGAVTAACGALLGLVAGVTRTALAMARNHDLPAPLARVHPVRSTPVVGELVLAVAVCALVLIGDLTAVVGASSFGVLLYYAVANAAAWTLPAGARPPRVVPLLGGVLCLVLAALLPPTSVVTAAAVLTAGLLGRAVAVHRRGLRS
ncbi:amino acid/polyamine/organocation transporter, APC superfamily [Klenkia soli]|uniref:Amino acid/polyamine/organocation transporter, APC superfamily n=1 Tax=Klenkia soli TaxID=1052260 RepID=A0A1H0FSH5_9ACTN|nr:APC family permease [Klenkia soli]SDN97628.1 amino acid/polyamine/organocation transporter, APC superfamily [Klenkia soli]